MLSPWGKGEGVGDKNYELKNQLGNVLVVVTDRKIIKPYVGGAFDGFESDLVSHSSYYPFGMEIKALSLGVMRHGFIGKENDNEISGNGNSQDHMFRQYSPRLARYKSLDPLSRSYPWNSPYAYAENRVIDGIDLEGREYLGIKEAKIQVVMGKVVIKVPNLKWSNRVAYERMTANMNNWEPGHIGMNMEVAQFKFDPPESVPVASNSNKTSDPNYRSTDHSTVRPLTKKGLPNKTHKIRTFSGASSASKAGAKGTLAMNAIVWGIQGGLLWARLSDENAINSQTNNELVLAMADVQYAIDNGIIDVKYHNVNDISKVINYVLQGETSKNRELNAIGYKIVKEISKNFRGSDDESNPIPMNEDRGVKVDNTSISKRIVPKDPK